MIQNAEFQYSLVAQSTPADVSALSTTPSVSGETKKLLQLYACLLYYGKTEYSNINELRYSTFSADKGHMESQSFPSFYYTIYLLYEMSFNYKVHVWKQCLQQ